MEKLKQWRYQAMKGTMVSALTLPGNSKHHYLRTIAKTNYRSAVHGVLSLQGLSPGCVAYC
jgi:hypothetical protein